MLESELQQIEQDMRADEALVATEELTAKAEVAASEAFIQSAVAVLDEAESAEKALRTALDRAQGEL